MKRDEASNAAGDVIAEMACDCVLMRSRLISRVITGIYDQELRPFGLNSPQFALLVVMSAMGPASRAEIGRYHRQDRSTLTRNLKIMLAEGWIEEVEGAASGRARPMTLTAAGSDLLRDVGPVWRAAQEQAKTLLGGKGVAVVMEIANELMKAKSAA
jgi:DNA-binding MarR family transcriptional regulator